MFFVFSTGGGGGMYCGNYNGGNYIGGIIGGGIMNGFINGIWGGSAFLGGSKKWGTDYLTG